MLLQALLLMLKLLHLLHPFHSLSLRIHKDVLHVKVVQLVDIVFALNCLLKLSLSLLKKDLLTRKLPARALCLVSQPS